MRAGDRSALVGRRRPKCWSSWSGRWSLANPPGSAHHLDGPLRTSEGACCGLRGRGNPPTSTTGPTSRSGEPGAGSQPTRDGRRAEPGPQGSKDRSPLPARGRHRRHHRGRDPLDVGCCDASLDDRARALVARTRRDAASPRDALPRGGRGPSSSTFTAITTPVPRCTPAGLPVATSSPRPVRRATRRRRGRRSSGGSVGELTRACT